MKDYADIFKTEIREGLSVNSGSFAVVDENLQMVLDEYGQYKAVIIDPSKTASTHDRELSLVSAMSDISPDEDSIARELYSTTPRIKHSQAVGYYLDLYAGHVTEGNFREIASSGGFATWTLCKLLEGGLIDGVIHVKESNDDDGTLFKYAISRTKEDIINGSKSRYYPAEFSKTIKEIKRTKGSYAIVGIPSFIMEIRLLAKVDPEVNRAIKYTLGLICGHQKSTKYAEALAWQHGIQPGDLQAIDFRKKTNEAVSYKYLTEFTGQINGKKTTFTKKQDDLFASDWAHGFFKTAFSDFTDDALNETADLALGDAWLDEYYSDSGGNNVLIVRHPDIAQIIKDGIKHSHIKVNAISPATVLRSQQGLIHHTQDEISYRLSKINKSKGWKPIKPRHSPNRIPFLRRRVQDLRREMAVQSHIAYQEAVALNNWQYFEKKMSPYIKQYKFWYKVIEYNNLGLEGFAKRVLKKLRKK